MKRLFFLLIIASTWLSSCVYLSQEYVESYYYKLNQMPAANPNTNSVDGSLMLRSIRSSTFLELDNLMAMNDDFELNKYNYNRWIAPYPEIAYDFLLQRFNEQRLFTKGTISTNSALMPDYVLECQLLEMMAYNNRSEEEYNFVVVKLHALLVKFSNNNKSQEVLLNKIYTYKVQRENYLVKSIPPAFSVAWSELADELIFDIVKETAKSDLINDSTIKIVD